MADLIVCFRMIGARLRTALILFVMLAASSSSSYALTENETLSLQEEISGMPIGERIAFWAEKFVGVPYDPDPLGEYVTKRAIVADDSVDCMYLTFRAVELASGRTPKESVQIALDKRFMKRGMVEDGFVVNYDDRFQYGEDMIDSGKWGREITGEIGKLTYIKGARGREKIGMVSKETLLSHLGDTHDSRTAFKSGDILFFIKSPGKRVVEEIVGHIGIVKQEGNGVYLIHAGGIKKRGGAVKKVSLYDYISSMPFVGVRAGRLE